MLAAFDLDIAPGELVAVTGPSGVGKSTLLDAILGFAPIESGSITTSTEGRVRRLGQDPIEDWRAQLAWVPQRPHVLAGSVADNVRLGAPDATNDDVARALTRAGDLLAELRTACDQGRRGRHRSVDRPAAPPGPGPRAGPRARPLLLDEPTAGLDPSAEARVVRTLQRRPAGQTVLVATHRPALLAAADRVVALQPRAARCRMSALPTCRPGGSRSGRRTTAGRRPPGWPARWARLAVAALAGAGALGVGGGPDRHVGLAALPGGATPARADPDGRDRRGPGLRRRPGVLRYAERVAGP